MENPQTTGTSGNGASPMAATAQDQGKHDPVMLFLAYFGIFSLIPYMTVKDDDYVRWHAKQGLTFTGVWIGLWILTMVLGIVPLLNLLVLIASPLIALAGLVLWIMALVKAFGGERWKIPVVGNLAEKW